MFLEYLPLGGAQEVGASCGLLTIGDTQILIDAGLRPSAPQNGSRTPDFSQLPSAIDAIIITHAHIDHTGTLPLVADLYPNTPIFATESTIALMHVLLVDSVRVMEAEHLRQEGETPLYNLEKVETLLARVKPLAFDQPFQPVAKQPRITGRFLRAGHILGAGMLVLDTPAGRVLHTGDFSITDGRTIKSVDLQALPDNVDLLICEGTYGNRTHTNRREEERRLVETVQSVVGAGGRVLFPAFGVGRAQEIILILKAFRSNGQIPPVPIYIDGMCRTVCATYQAQLHDLHPKLQNLVRNAQRPLFADPTLHVFDVNQDVRARLLHRSSASIVVSSSGMLSGGPAPLYARVYAGREQDSIVITGYQDEESPGAGLLRARQGDVITIDGSSIQLACQVHRYNLSAHADASQIEHLIVKVRPRQVILVHGNPASLESLADRLKGCVVAIPACGERVRVQVQPRNGRQSVTSVVPATQRPPDLPVEQPTPALLYAAVNARGATPRPWTVVEIGQAYYGAAYKPDLRTHVEKILASAASSAYFRSQRLGSQPTYIPRSPQEVEPITALVTKIEGLKPGAIVLVQTVQKQGEGHLAILLTEVQNGMVDLVAEGWKGRKYPWSVIQIVPDLARQDLLDVDPDRVKAALRSWRTTIDTQPVDLIALWDSSEGNSYTFEDLATNYLTTEARLALGLDLLTRGHVLWHRRGSAWFPRPKTEIFASQPGLNHHLQLVRAGNKMVQDQGERRGTLTGRSRWNMLEVTWSNGPTSWIASRHLTLIQPA